MDHDDLLERRLLILYATETGNARQVAIRIANEGLRLHFRLKCLQIEDYESGLLAEESVVLFVISTCGEGNFPKAANKFWSFLLRKSLHKKYLGNLRYGIFGLGDSSYSKFNYASKKLSARLMQLGALQVVPRGEGDESHGFGLDGALIPWLSALWSALLRIMPLKEGQVPIPKDVLLPPKYKIEKGIQETNENLYFNYLNAEKIAVRENRDLTPNCKKKVRHLTLKPNYPGRHSPGDHLILYPKNLPDEVNDAIKLLGLENVDENIRLIGNGDVKPFESLKKGTTLRFLLLCVFDLSSRPTYTFLEILSFFVLNEEHRKRIRELLSPGYMDDMYLYIHRARRTILEVLQDFPAIVPREYLFELLPLITPRYFSISSASKKNGEIDITVGIVRYMSTLKTPRKGLCTNWINQLKVSDEIFGKIVKGTIDIESMDNEPMIIVCTGTGIAPARSIVQHRILKYSKTVLIFGSRYKHKDFLYSDELLKYADDNKIKLFLAFSRDQPEKIYVQDIILSKSWELSDLIVNHNAYVLFFGNSKNIPECVQNALKTCIESRVINPNEYLENMKKNGNFLMECW